MAGACRSARRSPRCDPGAAAGRAAGRAWAVVHQAQGAGARLGHGWPGQLPGVMMWRPCPAGLQDSKTGRMALVTQIGPSIQDLVVDDLTVKVRFRVCCFLTVKAEPWGNALPAVCSLSAGHGGSLEQGWLRGWARRFPSRPAPPSSPASLYTLGALAERVGPPCLPTGTLRAACCHPVIPCRFPCPIPLFDASAHRRSSPCLLPRVAPCAARHDRACFAC